MSRRISRSERRYTPRRKQAATSSDAVLKEAELLARSAGRRLRLSGAATADEFKRLRLPDDPVARFAAILAFAEEKARTLPPAVTENTLRIDIWRKQLRDLEDGVVVERAEFPIVPGGGQR